MSNIVPGGNKGLLFVLIAGALVGFAGSFFGLPGWLIGAVAGAATPILAKKIEEKIG